MSPIDLKIDLKTEVSVLFSQLLFNFHGYSSARKLEKLRTEENAIRRALLKTKLIFLAKSLEMTPNLI